MHNKQETSSEVSEVISNNSKYSNKKVKVDEIQ